MNDIQSRAQRAEILAVEGDRAAAIAEYERILADIEAGKRFFGEAELRSKLAYLLHETADPREAQQLTKAVALFQRHGDIPGLIDACLRLAGFHRHSAAASLYWVDRAVAAAERGANPRDLCRALAIRGELLLAFNRVEEALAVLERVARLPGGHVHADTLASARVLAGQTEEGLATLTRALAEAERARGEDAAERVVTLSIRLADARRALGDRVAALELLKGAAARAKQLGEGGPFALLLDRLGHALLESGDPAGAVSTLELGIERNRAGRLPDPRELGSLYHNLGNALSAVGNEAGAIRAFSEATRLAQHVGDLRFEALAQFGLANSAAKIDATAAARQAYEEARGLAVRLQDQSLEAACLDSLGQLRSHTGEPAKAVDLHRSAARLHGQVGDHKGQHTDLLNLVQAFLLLGETAAARRALDEARAIAAAHFQELSWQQALVEGRVSACEGRWPLARSSFDAAITQLEAERVTLETPNDQRRWAAQRVAAFEFAAAAAFEAGDALAALAYLEGNRARFLEAVADHRRRLPAGLSAEARRAYIAATHRLAEIRWRRRQQPDVRDPALEQEFAQATRAWQELDAEVELLRMGEEPPPEPAPKPEQLAECLSVGEAAVALHVAGDWIGAACIGRRRNGDLWWACATDPRLTLADVSRAVVGGAEGAQTTTRPAWHDLASLPLAEAKRLVAGTCALLRDAVWPLVERVVQDRADALVLMPGRGLNVLPLHAAATADGRFALDRWSVRYAPSLNLLARSGPPGVLAPGRILGQVVNPTGDLPFAEPEATAIRGSWHGDVREPLSGAEAEPDQVLPLFEQTDVLHFAGHGAFDADDPLQSRLACAPGISGGAITLQALLERVPTVRTRVFLLSACETGRVVAGDPLNDQLGLPGGLLIAGASAVLATFWHVDDLAACLLLSRCIELWEQDSKDLERALAEAQQWLRTKATVRVVRDWIEDRLDESTVVHPLLAFAHGRLVVQDDDELLFTNELYWAPFHVTGRAIRTR
jgi:CHAT domain-containing protein/tetratricopeptide (TPR) repeat protein